MCETGPGAPWIRTCKIYIVVFLDEITSIYMIRWVKREGDVCNSANLPHVVDVRHYNFYSYAYPCLSRCVGSAPLVGPSLIGANSNP